VKVLLRLVFVLAAILLTAWPAPADPGEGLAVHLPFNGDAEDVSGRGNHGLVDLAAPAKDRCGREDMAMQFWNVDNGLVKIEGADMPEMRRKMSISAWIFPTKSDGDHVIVERFDPKTSRDFRLSTHDGFLRFWWSKTGSTEGRTDFDFFSSRKELVRNCWHHVVVSFSYGRVNMYIDGKCDTTTMSMTGSIFTGKAPVSIGGGLFQDEHCFDGRIDDVRIYERFLSGSEVKQLFEAGCD